MALASSLASTSAQRIQSVLSQTKLDQTHEEKQHALTKFHGAKSDQNLNLETKPADHKHYRHLLNKNRRWKA